MNHGSGAARCLLEAVAEDAVVAEQARGGFDKAGRGRPPTDVKFPPSSTLLSACRLSAQTALFAPPAGLKPLSTEPSALRRARLLRATPPTCVNRPPTRSLLSTCVANATTAPSTPPGGSKPVSRVPLPLSRARLLRAIPPTLVSTPPITTLPSACATSARTRLSTAPASKPGSSEPSAFRRATRGRVTPPIWPKSPPTSTLLPPGCTIRPNTAASAPPGRNIAPSTLPSGFRRAMFLQAQAPTWLKLPPMTRWPLGCTATACTLPSIRVAAKSASTLPSTSRRTRCVRGWPPICVKLPPTISLPSGCTASVRTRLSASTW